MKLARVVLLIASCLVLTFAAGGSNAAEFTSGDTPANWVSVAPAPSSTTSAAPATAAPAPTTAAAPSTTVTEQVVPESDNGPTPDPSSGSAIGALFSGGGHYCSASVVDSPAGDLVLTAAHCVHDGAGGGYHSDITFEPGYHNGVAPFGVWTVTQALVSPGWAATSDPDLDFAFLTVTQAGTSASLESLTGADKLGLDRGFTNDVTLTGYPDTSDAPKICSNSTTQQDDDQTRIACAGFPDGTSGGPWVIDADPATKLGTVVGVIGGYELGGDSPDVSYSAYFDDDVATLYATATSS
jgi:V8-like Glu-specific endopeptidase